MVRGIGIQAWTGIIMVGLVLVLGVPVAGGWVEPSIPRPWWVVVFLTTVVALVAAVWGDRTGPFNHAALAVAVVASWAVVLTAPPGFLAILVVFIAACSVYIVPMWVAFGIVALNTVVLAVSSLLWRTSGPEAFLTALLYLAIQIASVLSCYALIREQRTRHELTLANIELQTAAALLRESAQSEERLRISRDLHDSIGHSLTVLALELEAARHREGRHAGQHVERAAELARDLLRQMRATVGELRHEPADLRKALQDVFVDVPGLDVEVHVAPDVEVGGPEGSALVRAVQEILTNTLRHSGASRLTLEFHRGPGGETVLDAHDDGRGSPQVTMGNGLRGMAERMESLGGAVRIDGSSGFRVTVEVPAA